MESSVASRAAVLTPESARISAWDNWWVFSPLAALVAAIASHSFFFLLYVHLFAGVLWTGTDLFMGFIFGPILRRLDIPTRRAVILRLMPRMLFYMPTVATVTGTAGFYLASWRGLFTAPYPQAYWVLTALAVLAVLTIQGFGILLPTNLRVFFEMRKEQPDGAKIQRLMALYVRVMAIQGVMQVGMVFIMARFRTGL